MNEKKFTYVALSIFGLIALAAYIYFWKKKNPLPEVLVAPSTPPKSPAVQIAQYTPNDLHSLYKSAAYN